MESIAHTLASLLAGAIAAGLGWAATEFVARPIRRFYDLRGEIIQAMAQYGNIRARYTEDRQGEIIENSPALDAAEIGALEEAQRAIRSLAARMRAFALNETLAHHIITLLCYDPHKASQGLFGYSNVLNTYGGTKASKRQMIEDALRVPRNTL